jgi:hypothetical protein
MSVNKMTIHRALAELKLIDSRIEKSVEQIYPSAAMQKDKLIDGRITKEDFVNNAKSKMQSTLGLIDRKNKIKSAIVKANSETVVKIGAKEMNISDAISFRALIDIKKTLIQSLKDKHNRVIGIMNTNNEKVKTQAMENAKVILGKQGESDIKATDNDVKNIVEPFVERNEFHLVDPLKVEEVIENIEKETEEFETEIDAVLSEINAITIIEI